MEQSDWMKLKSGTDVRGVALEGVPGEEVNLTDEAVTGIMKAFCAWAAQRCGKEKLTIAIGHDSRLSAGRISACAVKAVTESGCDAIVTGLSSTPSMFMLLQEEDIGADASVMITASHLPFNKNGLKFFTPEGGLEGKDIADILAMAAEGAALSGSGCVRELCYIDRYSEGLVRFVREKTGQDRPLAGKKIVVDAGNGAGGFYVDKVLKPLGADTEGSQFLEPDGNFPNHIPNPEDKKAMHAISQRVKETGADFGIIFDTDVDRAGAVDKQGEEINRNRLIALISAILLQEKSGTIVTDSVTSDGLTAFIESRGGKHCRYKRGYRNVIDKAKELNAAGEYSPLAIETSGHAALMENYFLDDGAYLVTRILVSLAQLSKEGKDIGDLIADLPEPAEAAEVRLGFTTLGKQDFKNNGNFAIRELQLRVPDLPGMTLAAENFEGVRINFDKDHGDGWALVRMSLHEPIMPINFESNSKGGCCVIANELIALLAPYTGDIDLTNLQNYAGTSH
ncbi:MAG TPA: hypothetical protein H9851_04605 [Candidatus Borkfalkia faecavium]|uniref:Phosphomannomutase/phosphoglucomutase n=1 Tax=Candidatus Borkfalkia faecavium TaxID=2838508 RepID=A0A9D2AUB1_9FIRM|nr:hypothetical protein [Candidatus Borkfalkia faecavium]